MYLEQKLGKWSVDVCTAAAGGGSLECLKYAKEDNSGRCSQCDIYV